MKIKLIGDTSDGSDLIKKFKNMNHALLIVKNRNEIKCVYQNDAKDTHQNKFILSLNNGCYTWAGGDIYYSSTNNKSLKNEYVYKNDFSEKFSEVMRDLEEYIDKEEYAELFRIS